MLNPITKNFNYAALYAGFWMAIAIIQLLVFYFLLEIELLPAIFDALLFNLILAIICIAIWPIVTYSSLDRTQLLNTLITHLAGATVLIGLAVFLSWKLLAFINTSEGSYQEFLQDSLLWRSALGAIFYLLIALNLYVHIYSDEFKNRSIQEADLKRVLKETELTMLKSQLNPHFIFNSLNSISSLTLTNPEKAQEMVISLAEFLRYSIQPNQKERITLETELAAIEQYISIEKVRFGERLQIKISCKSNCKNNLLPPLIIQPLVENAIKYGIHETIENGLIEISCSCTNGLLEVMVKNNFDSTSRSAIKTGIGLKNVENRLHLLYGSKGLLKVEKDDSTFIVSLFIPQTEQV